MKAKLLSIHPSSFLLHHFYKKGEASLLRSLTLYTFPSSFDSRPGQRRAGAPETRVNAATVRHDPFSPDIPFVACKACVTYLPR
jgi:hypothetical protein